MKCTFHRAFGVFLLCALAPFAAQAGRFTLIEENDSITSKDDWDYTQGFRASWGFDPAPGGVWSGGFDAANRFTPLFGGGAGSTRQVDWIVLGQSQFTPRNKNLTNPNPADRPYAAWLYTGVGLLEDHQGKTLDNAELLVGVVGSIALGEQVQNGYHDIIGENRFRGWDKQIHNEPGIALSLERKWRLNQPIAGSLGVEAIPEAGATLGNVWTYAQTGVLLRFGQHLKADYGAPRIRPSLSGTGYFNPSAMTGWFGWYVYGGVQGRAVARNIMLDGNTFGDSRSVDKNVLVGDAVLGLALFTRDALRLDLAYTMRSKEFDRQQSAGHFGGINLGWQF